MKSFQAMSVQELRDEIAKVERLIGMTRVRLSNQERKRLDLKLILLERLEGSHEDQSS